MFINVINFQLFNVQTYGIELRILLQNKNIMYLNFLIPM